MYYVIWIILVLGDLYDLDVLGDLQELDDLVELDELEKLVLWMYWPF